MTIRIEHQFTPQEIEQMTLGKIIEVKPYKIGASYFDFGVVKYVALTSFNGDTPIGICDFRYRHDVKNAVLESPIIVKRPDLKVPGLDLRAAAGTDGIFVEKGYRGDGVGSVLMRSAMEIAKSFGAERFIVNQPNPNRKHWFEQLGGKEALGAYVFQLK